MAKVKMVTRTFTLLAVQYKAVKDDEIICDVIELPATKKRDTDTLLGLVNARISGHAYDVIDVTERTVKMGMPETDFVALAKILNEDAFEGGEN